MPGPHEALSAALESWNAGDLDGYTCACDERQAEGSRGAAGAVAFSHAAGRTRSAEVTAG